MVMLPELQAAELGSFRKLSTGVPPSSDDDSHDDFKPKFKYDEIEFDEFFSCPSNDCACSVTFYFLK